jgi:hypothetical protein
MLIFTSHIRIVTFNWRHPQLYSFPFAQRIPNRWRKDWTLMCQKFVKHPLIHQSPGIKNAFQMFWVVSPSWKVAAPKPISWSTICTNGRRDIHIRYISTCGLKQSSRSLSGMAATLKLIAFPFVLWQVLHSFLMRSNTSIVWRSDSAGRPRLINWTKFSTDECGRNACAVWATQNPKS